MAVRTLDADFPKKLQFLFRPKRYKVAKGGRGSAKSWSYARALIILAAAKKLRILCAREVQKSIKQSVHQLLVDQIQALGYGQFFDVFENEIRGKNGTQFFFTGLSVHTVESIKSFEAIDIVWVEEAQTVSRKSWTILIPTIRKDGSEIWISFNPDLDTDETYLRFVETPPDDAIVETVNYRDNPWFPEVLEKERLEAKKKLPKEEYENIWEGKCKTSVDGAIYANEIATMLEERRIRPVPYDPKLLVHTIWDLGWNDQTSIVFAQRVMSEVRIIDYEEESFLRFDQWAKRIKDKPYHYGDHWLPHDGANELQAANGVSAQAILTPLLRTKPKIIKRPATVEVPIRAARMLFPRVYLDEVKGKRLLQCLKRFRRGIPESTGEPGTPVKDEWRHGADAFGGLAQIVDQLGNETNVTPPPAAPFRPLDRGMGYVFLFGIAVQLLARCM